MRRGNAKPEGHLTGTLSVAGPEESGPLKIGSGLGEGEDGDGGRIGELFTSLGSDVRDSDVSDGIPEAKRRGRPKGSKNAGTKPATRERLAAATAKLADAATGVVGFTFSVTGVIRAKKYKRIHPVLAQRVYNCYQIPEGSARGVGEPLAQSFAEWFPQYVDVVSKGIDPTLCVARLLTLVDQVTENEKIVVEQFIQEQQGQPIPPTNGRHTVTPPEPPPGEAVPGTQEFEQWMNQQPQSPSETERLA